MQTLAASQALAAAPARAAQRPLAVCSLPLRALRLTQQIAQRTLVSRSAAQQVQLYRRRRAPAVRASATAVPTAAPGATKVGFLGIGIMGMAMVRWQGSLGRGCCML